FRCTNLLELGGGRSPLFFKSEIDDLGANYTVNDISERELAAAPPWVTKVCFDAAGEASVHQQYDLVFSRMVLEHVPSAESLYRNVFNLLSRGGICLNFHPTLFAVPFVINLLLPSRLSQIVLSAFGALVTDAESEYPKFPARYDWCRSSPAIQRRL